jgi:pyroglutamyl-peptidase
MDMSPILVTGFEPYGGRGTNPSYQVMRALDGKTIACTTIIGRGLPVSLATLQGNIEKILDDLTPSAIISLGLWPGEPAIRIERVGLNVADFEIADNEGTLPRDCEVSSGGAAARFASLPVRAIEEAVLAAGIPARLSATAGTFLCNACLYTFLTALERKKKPIPCGFIHLPYTPEQVAVLLKNVRSGRKLEQHQRSDLASMDLPCTIRAVEIAIATTARFLAPT